MDRRRRKTTCSHETTSQEISIKFRRVNHESLEAAKIIVEFLKEHHTTDSKYLPKPEHLFSKLNFYMLLKDNGATLLGVTCFQKLSDHLAITRLSCIHKDYRGKGYGRFQSECLEEEIRKAGCGKIFCEIYSDNLANLNLKLSQGFQIEGFHRDHFDRGRDEYSLGKILV